MRVSNRHLFHTSMKVLDNEPLFNKIFFLLFPKVLFYSAIPKDIIFNKCSLVKVMAIVSNVLNKLWPCSLILANPSGTLRHARANSVDVDQIAPKSCVQGLQSVPLR